METKLTTKEVYTFIYRRLDGEVNHLESSEINKWINNVTYENYKDYTFIDDGAHAYCIVRPNDKNYGIAKACASSCSTRYTLPDGTLLLEEDCDATEFLNQLTQTV